MKKRFITGCVLLCTVLAACTQKEAKLTGVVFEREHGSVWGDQFYIEVYPDEVAVARCFPEGSADQEVREHIPLADGQWQELTEAIKGMTLKVKRGDWIEKLFGGSKRDGTERRSLTLTWETDKGSVQRTYQWPQSAEAEVLERLLERLAAGV